MQASQMAHLPTMCRRPPMHIFFVVPPGVGVTGDRQMTEPTRDVLSASQNKLNFI